MLSDGVMRQRNGRIQNCFPLDYIVQIRRRFQGMLNAPNGIPLKLLNKAEYVLLPRSTRYRDEDDRHPCCEVETQLAFGRFSAWLIGSGSPRLDMAHLTSTGR